MPIYEYKCNTCNDTFERYFRVDQYAKSLLDGGSVACGRCSTGHLKRVYSFAPGPMFEPHYNVSQGEWVNSFRELNDNAKRASEIATNRTGVEHNFTPIPIQEAKIESDEGLRSTHDRAVAEGRRESVRRVR